MTTELRDYQVAGANFLLTRRRAILADEMGLGKTVQALHALEQLTTLQYDELPFVLILCPKITVSVWLTEIQKWYQKENMPEPIVVLGTPKKREEMWGLEGHIWITTYDSAIRDCEQDVMWREWDVIICDEAHRMRNRKTKAFKTLMTQLARVTDYLFLLTGTPVRGCAANLWTLLNLINPRLFSSYWRFANTWSFVVDGGFGKTVEGVKNPINLRKMLRQYLLRRSKKKVLPQLPPKTRQYIDITPTDEQVDLYNEIVEEAMVMFESGELLATPTLLAQITRLRQILVCPTILSDTLTRGAAISTMIEHIGDNEPESFVIFTPYAKAVPHILAALKPLFDVDTESRFLGQIVGGMKPVDVAAVEACFRSQGGCIVATIKAAQSYNLERGQAAYFIGTEWTVDENEQAEDRLHRGTTKHPVNVYYFRHRGTVEEDVFNILTQKKNAIDTILKDPLQYLKHVD